MIKVSKFIYIHFSFVFLLVICYFNRNMEILAISYGSMFIHELAHLLAAFLIGLKSSHIVLYAFGVNLKLKNTIIYSLADEIILYFSGPLVNALLAIISILMLKNGNIWYLIYVNNIMLFVFNLLPIVPMDGGIILKKIITRKVGYKNGIKIINTISTIFIIILIVTEIVLIKKSRFNYSIIFISIFLIGNIFINKEKYHLDLIKEMMFYKKKNDFKIKKVKSILIKSDVSYKELVENFSQSDSYIIFKEDDTGKIKEILTEKEIAEDLLK